MKIQVGQKKLEIQVFFLQEGVAWPLRTPKTGPTPLLSEYTKDDKYSLNTNYLDHSMEIFRTYPVTRRRRHSLVSKSRRRNMSHQSIGYCPNSSIFSFHVAFNYLFAIPDYEPPHADTRVVYVEDEPKEKSGREKGVTLERKNHTLWTP